MYSETGDGSAALLVWSIVLAGLIGSARLYLHAHTPAQIYLGYGYGIALTSVVLYLSASGG